MVVVVGHGGANGGDGGRSGGPGNQFCLREDVGRHNALDKLIGKAVQEEQIPCRENILVLSGRIGFEWVQKASMLGIPIVLAVGAPSSLAIETAEEHGISLIGFTRADRCNIYSGEGRIAEGARMPIEKSAQRDI